LSRIDYGNVMLAGLPTRQLCRLQSVLHAAARIIFSARKFDHVTPLFHELHWLRVPERITLKLASLVFRCLIGTAPVYLADSINRTDVKTRRSLRLRSSSLTAVDVPVTRRSTIVDRAFPVAAACAWNSLPSFVTSASSVVTVDFEATFKDVLVCNVGTDGADFCFTACCAIPTSAVRELTTAVLLQWGYRGGSHTAVQVRRLFPLWEPCHPLVTPY